MKNSVSLVLAAVFPLALFSWFLPTPYNQLDFLILWLFAMCVIALPTVYAEVALANRSGLLPMNGIQKLTREADASTLWRGVVWGGMAVMLLLAVALVAQAATLLHPVLNENVGLDIAAFVLPFILIIAVTIVSVWGLKIAIVGLGLMILSLLLNVSGDAEFALTMTSTSIEEWARAVILALISVGAGSGLYWFTKNAKVASAEHDCEQPTTISDTQQKQVATPIVLPIWGAQVIAGAVAFFFIALAGDGSVVTNVTKASGLLCISAVLLHFVSQSLSEKMANGKIGFAVALLVIMVLGLFITVPFVWLPLSVLQALLVISSLAVVMMLSIFTGWQMKISHLRKSMNFSNELKYNLWRVAIRLVVPISIVLALVGWLKIWL